MNHETQQNNHHAQPKHLPPLWMRLSAGLALSMAATACLPQTQATDSQQQSLDTTLEQTSRIVESIKCIVPSPQWYKNLWLDLNGTENELGRALMTHYMGCSGTAFKLTEAQFRSLPVALVPEALGGVFVTRSFVEMVMKDEEKLLGRVIEDVDESVLASTHYGNTLGHFELQLRGQLLWQSDFQGQLVPHFRGQARIKDSYDFNPSESQPKESWRGRDTELRVRIAHVAMPGKNFQIESDWMHMEFRFPKYESDLIQFSQNDEKSGYSDYGERLQAILMTEMRSTRWQKASHMEKVKITINMLKRLHQATTERAK